MAGPALVGTIFTAGSLTGAGTASLTSGSTTAGNGLFVWGYIQGASSGYTGFTVADGGNTWNVRTVFRNAGRSVFCAWTTVTSSGARSIVVTGTGGSGGMFGGVAGGEFTIPAAISADQIGSGTAFAVSPAVVTAGGTDAGTTDLVLAAIAIGGGTSNSNIATPPATGYTNAYATNNDSTDSSGELAYRINTTAVIDSATWTFGASGVDGSAAAVWSFQFGGGGDVTVGLTGALATWSAGNVTPSTTKALTGSLTTFSAGTVTSSRTVALTGAAGTWAAGNLAPGRSIPLTNALATFAAGTLLPSTTVGLTNALANWSTGTVSVAGSGDVTVALTGAASTWSAGNLGSSRTLAVTGALATWSAGTLTATPTIGLTNAAATFSAGTVTQSRTVALTDALAVWSAGNVGVQGDVTVALTGAQANWAAGTVTVSTSGAVSPSTPGFEGRKDTGSEKRVTRKDWHLPKPDLIVDVAPSKPEAIADTVTEPDAIAEQSREVSRRLDRVKAQIQPLQSQIALLEAQLAEEGIQRTRAQQAAIEREARDAQQQMVMLAVQQAVLLEEQEVMDIAYVAAQVVAML